MRKLGLLGLVLVFVASLSVAQDSTVVVFRRTEFAGSALKPSIFVDGTEAARLANGRYLSLQVAAGKHSFGSSVKKEAPLEVEAKPNETLYLEMIIVTGWNRGGRLIPVGQDEAMNALARLKTQDGKLIALAQTSTAQREPAAENNSQAEETVVAQTTMQPATVIVKSTPPGTTSLVDRPLPRTTCAPRSVLSTALAEGARQTEQRARLRRYARSPPLEV